MFENRRRKKAGFREWGMKIKSGATSGTNSEAVLSVRYVQDFHLNKKIEKYRSIYIIIHVMSKNITMS